MARRWLILSVILVALAGPAVAALPEGESVMIYRADGTLQCNQGREISVDVMRGELERAGIHVLRQEKRRLPIMIAARCGMPTGMANTYVISPADWRRLEQKGTLGFERWIWGAN